MYKFSKRSKDRLRSCDDRLVHICEAVLARQEMDFSVSCGYRNKEDQNKAFEQGRSKAKWKQSAHNHYPSKAVDIAPYPIDWNDKYRFKKLADLMKEEAEKRSISITWGGDWQYFYDGVHFQLED